MFAVKVPQSISLITPGEDGPFTQLNFRTHAADTSRCILEVITPEGDLHRMTFNHGGNMVDQQFVDHDSAPEPDHKPLTDADYIVGGRDTRADNPYTHVVPMGADAQQRGDYDVGGKQPMVYDKDGKPAFDHIEMTKTAVQQAKEQADKTFKAQQERANETTEQRQERRKKEEAERHEEAHKQLVARAEKMGTEPSARTMGEPDREPDGSLSSQKQSPEPSRDPGHYDPLVPAASSPLPGSPPPHRIDSANPTNSVINTSGSIAGQGPDEARHDHDDTVFLGSDRKPYDETPDFNEFSQAHQTDPGPNPFANPVHPVNEARPQPIDPAQASRARQGVVNTTQSLRGGNPNG